MSAECLTNGVHYKRRSEIAALQWSWIDFKEKTITLPAATTKNGREHQFPIGDLAISVLKRVPRLEGNPYVFPAAKNRYAIRPDVAPAV